MLVDLILDLLQGLLVWLGDLFPDQVGDFDPVGPGWTSALGHMGAINYFLPVAELFAFTVGIVVAFPAFMGVTLTVWLVSLIRGGSARA